ncbi:MAG: DUF4423 domain-containing protein, partial [Proteobacteria bacterium]|nr:DUF4423 domain-containing protein [Pseudomonadota bacterium]
MTAEQAIGLASFWHLAPLEVEYFLTLVHLARAGVPKLKKYYEQQAERIRRAGHSVTQRMAGEQIGANEACEYYSNWHWMAIHTLLAVPGHTTAPKIARRLGISESIVARSLTTMQGWGLVIREAKGWNILKDNLHLPNTSPMTRVNHANWRRRAELDMERENENSLHYTAV